MFENISMNIHSGVLVTSLLTTYTAAIPPVFTLDQPTDWLFSLEFNSGQQAIFDEAIKTELALIVRLFIDATSL